MYQRFKKFLIIQLFVVLSPALLDQITSCTHTGIRIIMAQVVKEEVGTKIAIGGMERYEIIGAGGLWPSISHKTHQ